MPRIHMLVPAYGRAGYLRETLASVVVARAAAEDPDAVEITVVDDASPDDEIADLVRGEPSLAGVGYVRNPTNLGLVANFNACAAMSVGDYTVIMGSDDLVEPGYFAGLHDTIARFPGADLVQPAVAVVDEQGRRTLPLGDRVKALLRPGTQGAAGVEVAGQALATRLLAGNFLYFPSIAWRTEVLRSTPFDPAAGVATDLDVELRLVAAGSSIAVAGGPPTFLYRRHAASLSMQGGASGTRIREETLVHRRAARRAREQAWPAARAMAVVAPTARLNRGLTLVQGALSRVRPGS